MRILQVCSASSFGGGERHLADLSNSLSDSGTNVYVVLRPRSALEPFLTDVPPSNIFHLSLRNAADIKSAIQISKIAAEIGAEVLHAHLARDYPIVAVASRLSNIPFILTRHVLFPMKRVPRLLLRNVSRVIAPSKAVYQRLIDQQTFPSETIVLIRNGVDVDRFSAAELKTRDRPTVGTIGHMAHIKGHDVFIKAANIVLQTRPDVYFRIIGDDKSRSQSNLADMRSLIRTLCLEKNVELAGWTNDTPAELAKMDVFVSAARSEPFGLVMAEAMASRVPVIATKSEGAVEIVEDGVSGLLTSVGDEAELADRILELLADVELRDRLADAAFERVNEHFSLSRMVKETERLYASVIGAAAQPRA